MSSRRLRLAFARQAQRDLYDILQHSLQEWGAEQHDQYAALLQRGVESLIDYPNLGRIRDDIHPGYRFYLVGQHVICYSVNSRTLRVLRILHQRMDLRRAFRGSP